MSFTSQVWSVNAGCMFFAFLTVALIASRTSRRLDGQAMNALPTATAQYRWNTATCSRVESRRKCSGWRVLLRRLRMALECRSRRLARDHCFASAAFASITARSLSQRIASSLTDFSGVGRSEPATSDRIFLTPSCILEMIAVCGILPS